VLEALVHLSQASHYSLVSLVIALWGALKLITGLDRSFEAIFESEPVSPTQRVTKGVLTLTVVGLAAIAVAVLVAAIGLIEHPHSHYGPLVLVVVLTVVFFPIFYLLPNADLTPGDALPGTLLTAIGWTVLSTGFAIYVGLLGETIAGVVGAFLLLLTWFYFSGLVILLGGVLNAALLDSKEIRRRRDGPGSGANGS
jgi:YihY family inner membrane protein